MAFGAFIKYTTQENSQYSEFGKTMNAFFQEFRGYGATDTSIYNYLLFIDRHRKLLNEDSNNDAIKTLFLSAVYEGTNQFRYDHINQVVILWNRIRILQTKYGISITAEDFKQYLLRSTKEGREFGNKIHIKSLKLSPRTYRSLRLFGYTNINEVLIDLQRKDTSEFVNDIRGFGKNSYEELIGALTDNGYLET